MALRILIVDDDPTVLAIAQAALEQLGHRVKAQDEAFGTTDRILREKPDVVLMDVNLPGLSGARLVELAAERQDVECAFVLWSGIDEKELDEMCREVGAFSWISKKLGPADFARRFTEVTQPLARAKRSGRPA